MNNQENGVECTKLMKDLKILQKKACNLFDAIEVIRNNQLDTQELVIKSELQNSTETNIF